MLDHEVAGIVDVDPTHVQGLVGFYTLFFDEPHGQYVVQYCNDLPCALRGADEFLEVVAEKLGCRPGETSDDGMFTLETVMCLAACDKAPMMQVNLEYFEDLDEAKLDALVAEWREKAAGSPERRVPFGLGPPSKIGAEVVPVTNGAGEEAAGQPPADLADMPDLASGAAAEAGRAVPPGPAGEQAPPTNEHAAAGDEDDGADQTSDEDDD